MKRIVFVCDLCGAHDETGETTQGLLFLKKDMIEPPEKFRLVDPLHADIHVCLDCIKILSKYQRGIDLQEEMAK